MTHEGVAEAGEPPVVKPGAAPTPKPAPSPAPAAPTPADAAPTVRTVIVRVAHHAEGVRPEGTDVPLIAQNGEIRITTERKGKVPVVFACFFYMH